MTVGWAAAKVVLAWQRDPFGRCEFRRLHAGPALQRDLGGALLLAHLVGFVLCNAPRCRHRQHLLAAGCCAGQASASGLELLVRVVLHQRGELEGLRSVVGLDVGERGLQPDVRRRDLHRSALAVRHGLRRCLPEGSLLGGHPLLARCRCASSSSNRAWCSGGRPRSRAGFRRRRAASGRAVDRQPARPRPRCWRRHGPPAELQSAERPGRGLLRGIEALPLEAAAALRRPGRPRVAKG